jgi:hypothetical protein
VTTFTTIDLYPATDGDRIYIFVTGVGQVALDMPLIFDTGSAGLTLDAHAVLPLSMFDSNGLLTFANNEASFAYNGITVMNQPGSKSFGGKNGFTETGYMGYAQVTFGDARGQLTTTTIPMFLYDFVSPSIYTGTGLGSAQGIFGVDDVADLIGEATGNGPFPECTKQTAPPCYVVSVLKSLNYTPGLNAGFKLTPALLQPCSILAPGDCTSEPMLTVGLSAATTAGFSVEHLTCPPAEDPVYQGANSIGGFSVCGKSIAGSTIQISGASDVDGSVNVNGPYSEPVLFDSGTVPTEVLLSTLPSEASLSQNASVTVTLPHGFTYNYTTMDDVQTETILVPDVNNGQNHVGVGYFEMNSFFIDYSGAMEGWMLGGP